MGYGEGRLLESLNARKWSTAASFPSLSVHISPQPSAAFPQRSPNTVDLGQRQRATLWTWSKPATALSTGWLEATWATALDACWRLDASEKSTISDHPHSSHPHVTNARPGHRPLFHKLVHSHCERRILPMRHRMQDRSRRIATFPAASFPSTCGHKGGHPICSRKERLRCPSGGK